MSDPQRTPDDRPEVEALGADPDFVTTDHDLDTSDPIDEQGSEDDDEVDVSDLP